MPIPPFRDDGNLPTGLHVAEVDEIRLRFGESSNQRRALMERVSLWVELARAIGAKRLLLDGSFVTRKVSPNDVDAVMLLPADFQQRLSAADPMAWEIYDSVRYGPEELIAAYNERDWIYWANFFEHVRESAGVRRGLVEVLL
jgi:uncharacterized protein DUF6932